MDAKGVNLVLELRKQSRKVGEDGGCLAESAAFPHKASPTPGCPNGAFRVQGEVVLPSHTGHELCLLVVSSVTRVPDPVL